MADITKCKGEKKNWICPLRKQCYRHIARANQYGQSYFMKVPYDFKKKNCSHFVEL